MTGILRNMWYKRFEEIHMKYVYVILVFLRDICGLYVIIHKTGHDRQDFEFLNNVTKKERTFCRNSAFIIFRSSFPSQKILYSAQGC